MRCTGIARIGGIEGSGREGGHKRRYTGYGKKFFGRMNGRNKKKLPEAQRATTNAKGLGLRSWVATGQLRFPGETRLGMRGHRY